jgi:hypothetical protein
MRQQSTAAPEKGRVAVGGGLFGIYGSDRIIWIVYIYIICVCILFIIYLYIYMHGYMYRLIWIYPCRIVKFNETIDIQGYNE